MTMRILALLLLAAAAWAAQAPTIDQVHTAPSMWEDAAITSYALTGIAPGRPGAAVTVSASVDNTALLYPPTVLYTSPASTGEVLLQPRPDRHGEALVTILVQDDAGGSATMAFAVLVANVNDPPSFIVDDNGFFDEDADVGSCRMVLDHVLAGPADEDSRVEFLVGVEDPGLVQFDHASFNYSTRVAFLYFRPQPDRFGITKVAITVIDVGDGSGLRSPASHTEIASVSVFPINDPPMLAANRPLAVGVGGTVAVGAGDLAITDADQAADSTLAWTLETPPAAGEWRLDGAPLAAGGRFTQADIAAGRVSYRHLGGAAGGDALGLRYSDGVIAQPLGPVQVAIAVAGRSRPAVALLASSVPSWTEGAAATPVAPAAQVEDGDSPVLDGGSLTVALGDGSRSDDRLSILAQGVGAGQIGLDGELVLWGGRPIGRWSGGAAAAPLVVALTGAEATPAAVQALLRQVAFSNDGDDPGNAQRTISVVVDDGEAGASLPVATPLAVEPVNDPPQLLTRAIATPPGLGRRFVLRASDPDSHPPNRSFAIAGQPANATVTMTGAPWTGACTIVPSRAGTADFMVSLIDGDGGAVTMPVTLTVTGPGTPRPHPRSDPPLAAETGAAFRWELACDAGDLGAGAELDIDLSADAPAQATASPTGPASATITWDIPATALDGSYRRLTVIASDRDGRGATFIPLTLRLVAPPKASQ